MEYLAAVGVLGAVWLCLFALRRDLRAKMLWTSTYWMILLSLGFLILRILFPHLPPQERIVPGYWDPDTLFDLARITSGWSVEDALYMFFTGGIASVLYDVAFRKRVPVVAGPLMRRRRAATLIPALPVLGMALFLHINLIWELIAFCGFGALVIWVVRPDLITRSLVGGLCYTLLYYGIAVFLLQLYPDYLTTHYNLSNLSAIFIGQLPLEEMLFAFAFGLMWSPIYEYAKDIRKNITSPSAVPAT